LGEALALLVTGLTVFLEDAPVLAADFFAAIVFCVPAFDWRVVLAAAGFFAPVFAGVLCFEAPAFFVAAVFFVAAAGLTVALPAAGFLAAGFFAAPVLLPSAADLLVV